MKFFLDTADHDKIVAAYHTGLLSGITTNPSHLSKSSHANPHEYIQSLQRFFSYGPLSVQVTKKEPEEVYKQARMIFCLGETIVVKIPCHRKYYWVIKKLCDEGIKVNVTLVFTAVQGLMMARLGAAYVSPFVGRLEDSGSDGVQMVRDLCEMFRIHKYDTKVIAASLRSVEHVHQVALAGAPIATVSPELFEQCMHHDLVEQGMKKFDEDWQKLGVTEFP